MVTIPADWLLAIGMWVLLLLYARWLDREQERLEREERLGALRKAASRAERLDGRPAPGSRRGPPAGPEPRHSPANTPFSSPSRGRPGDTPLGRR